MPEPAPERTPPDDTTESPRHTPTVPNPCGTTRDVLFVGDGVHVCEHIPDHARAADDREHICCCGFVWNDSEVPAITAPVTAEDLRGRLVGKLLASWVNQDLPSSQTMAAEAAARDVNTILAALAGDPGDLPARMAAEMRRHRLDERSDDEPGLTICVCGEQVVDFKTHWARVAMSVRWEHAASQAAQVERLRAELAEAQADQQRAALADEIALEHATAADLDTRALIQRAEHAEAERDALKAAIEEAREERDAARLVSQGRTMEHYDAEAAIERIQALINEYANEHHEAWRPLATATAKVFQMALDGETGKLPKDLFPPAESNADARTPVTAGTEAHGEAGETQRGSDDD